MDITLKEFCSKKIKVENYHREYKCSEKFVEGLVESIPELIEENDNFLSLISFVMDKDTNTSKIIDGLQRTVSLKLIECYLNLSNKLPIKQIINNLELLEVNYLDVEKFKYFLNYLKKENKEDLNNIYIRNFLTIKKTIDTIGIEKFDKFYNIIITIQYRKEEQKIDVYLRSNS